MCFGASWADLGAQKLPKGRPKGTQEMQKTKPNRHQIFDFWTDFGSIWGALEMASRLQGGSGVRAWRNARGLAYSMSWKKSKQISKTIQSRSDPSGGAGFNSYPHSAAPAKPATILEAS